MEKPRKTRKKETDKEEMEEQDQTKNQATAERRQTAWKERQRLVLKELIQEYIDEEASDEHLDIAKASMKELKQIQVVLKE